MTSVLSARGSAGLIGLVVASSVAAAGWPSAAMGDTTHGALVCQANSDPPITDGQLRNLIADNLPACNKKLLVLTQCYGGDFLDDFALMANLAIACATDAGQESHYGFYDVTASVALYNEAGRTAQDLHTEATANHHPLETPRSGGGMPLDQFPLDYVPGGLQYKLHILFYAGQPNMADFGYLVTIRERNPDADIVVVSSGLLAPDSDFPATYDGLLQAFQAIAGNMGGCDHRFVMFATDHGQQTFEFDDDLDIPPGNTQVDTPALPAAVGQALDRTTDPHTYFVIFVPLFGTGVQVDADGDPPLFGAGQWTVSIPMPTPPTPLILTQYTQIPVELGGDAMVGDDPGEGVLVRFEMPAQSFIDAFVGHANTVTITNNTGQAWTIDFILDPGPIEKVPQPVLGPGDLNCDGDMDGDDVNAFVLALLDANAYYAAHPRCDATYGDINADGLVDSADAGLFVQCLLNGACP